MICFRRRHRVNQGFTLLELLIVIAIIGTLAAIAIPNYISYRERARYAQAIQTLRMISTVLEDYAIDNGDHPDSLADAGLGGLRDPWGNPYQYLNINVEPGLAPKDRTKVGEMRKDHSMVPVNSDYDLYSMGPDGKSQKPFTAKDSRDDIVRAYNGGFFGWVSDC
ncbi:MAG: prepilin-type N-terminal cleavage/methylation domain-containing protein [Desulfofustis sp.]|nr:prepilin-type N-terminal cleavage/methylation domain-containing protein [Desulfofustis sp.]